MRRPTWLLVLMVVVGLPAGLVYQLLSGAVVPARTTLPVMPSKPDRLPALTPVPPTANTPVAPDWQKDVYPAQVDPQALDEQAVTSLRQGRVYGDPRTPPVLREAAPSETPSPAELADPERYAEYEGRQQRKLIAGFLRAAGPEISRMQQQLVVAEQAGLARPQLDEGREKLARLAAMQAEMAARYPELARGTEPLSPP